MPRLIRWALVTIRLPGGLAEHLGQAHHRHRAGADDVGQHLPRPDRGQLVDVADQQQRRLFRQACSSARMSGTSTMLALVHDQQVAVERVQLGRA